MRKTRKDRDMFKLPEEKPVYWSDLQWALHHWPGGPGGPVNYPADMDAMQAAMAMHTMSYLLSDQKIGQTVREILENEIVTTTRSMSRHHDEIMKTKTSES
jgi:hypothetical protein